MYFEVLDTNVRMMGSMHMIPASASGLPNWVNDAYEWSEVLVFESDPATILEFIEESEPTNWQSQLSATTLSRLKSIWRANEFIPEIERVHSWAAMLFSSVFAIESSEGVEPCFLREESINSKEVYFLEKAETVANIFSTIPKGLIIEAMETLASDLSAPQRMIEKMYSVWVNKNIEELYKTAMMSEQFRNPLIREVVLERRNELWMPEINKLFKSNKNTLVAVGALHLHGSGNLIELIGRETNRI